MGSLSTRIFQRGNRASRYTGVGGIALGLVVAASIGVIAGVGSYTFHYGEGWSYFSKDPTSCTNCHVMQPHYDSWQKSSHRAVASCIDCHLPSRFPHSYISKADNGFFHSWAFTFQNFHEPIQIKPRNRRILESSCLDCHGAMVDSMHGGVAFHDASDQVSCLHCHADVGHTSRPRNIGW